MEKAFEYVADYFGGNKSEDRDKRLKQDLSSGDVKYLYFDCGFGFNDIFILLLMQYLKQFQGQIKDADRRFLKSCLDYVDGKPSNLIKNNEVSFQEKYDFYMSSATEKYTDYDFQLYLYYLRQYDHKKAISMIKPGTENNKALKKIIQKHQGIEDDYEKYLDRYDGEEDEDDTVYYATPNSKIYMRNTEPEVWDDDYMTPIPEDPDREEDDETWLLEAAEGYEPEEEPQPYFDVVEFERLCMEMSDLEGVEEITRDPFSKRLTEHHDLNVQEYWEENKELFELLF